MSFNRPRKHHSGNRRVEPKKFIGSGGSASAYMAEEYDTDLYDCGVKIARPSKKMRVVKAFSKSNANYAANYEYQHAMPHLHLKPPVHSNGMFQHSDLVMDYVPGKVLTADEHNRIPSDQVFPIIVALLNAWKKQVFDMGLIHCDIKFDNFKVDLTNPCFPIVNFLDSGLARKQGSSGPVLFYSTEEYSAPEFIAQKGVSVSCDIYSLGKIINRLSVFISDQDRKVKIENNTIQDQLRDLILRMCHKDPARRPDFDQIYQSVQQMRLVIKSQNFDTQQTNELALAYKLAHQAKSKSIAEIKKIIEENAHFNAQEFIETLGQKTFFNCKTRNDILQRINEVTNQYQSLSDKLPKLIANLNQFSARHQAGSLFKHEAFGETIKKQRHIFERKLEKYTSKIPTSIDEMVEAVQSMQRAIDEAPSKLQMLIKHRCVTLNNNINNAYRIAYTDTSKALKNNIGLLLNYKASQDCSLEEFKTVLRAAVTEYLKDAATVDALNDRKRLASERRINDVKDILTIINNANDKASLIKDLNARIREIRTGIFGFSSFFSYHFGHSELRDQVEIVLKNYM